MIEQVRAVIFDMDGLLVDSEIVYQRVWMDSAAAFNLPLTHEMFTQLMGRGRKGALEKLKDFFGTEVPIDGLNAELALREARYFQETPPPPKKGAESLLRLLSERGVPKAVATSSRIATAESRLSKAGLRDHFPVLVTIDMVERGKPDPDIFLKASEKLQCAPSGCVVLEDSLSGIMAAKAAGMRGVLVPDMLAPTDEVRSIAHAVFTDLDEVSAWIQTVL